MSSIPLEDKSLLTTGHLLSEHTNLIFGNSANTIQLIFLHFKNLKVKISKLYLS